MKEKHHPNREENAEEFTCCGNQPSCCGRGAAASKEPCDAEPESNDMQETSSMSMAEVLQTQLQQARKEANEHKDKYLRILAEMENMRKRLQKEKQEISKYAAENVIVDFLAPLDQFETALQYAEKMSDEVRNWATGFSMILTQLKDVLVAQEVQPFESVGTVFNPHFHEAVEMVESEEAIPGTIVKEYSRGYKMGDRVIRPARVQVAKELRADICDDSNTSQIKA